MTTSRRPSAPLITGLGAIIAVAMALPLLAPSCSDYQPGLKLFAKGSLIIPMDVCYQYQTDEFKTAYTPTACPGAAAPGDVIMAYGLVYQLIRNGVAVYWIIDPQKGSLTGVDLTLQFSGGLPVHTYEWGGRVPAGAPATTGSTIRYLGGPFVIDGSDAVKAAEVLRSKIDVFRPSASSGVNVHVANVAFQANVAKMLAGGWSAGGTVPPKLALLNIGSSGGGSSKNSEVVIRGYLQKAGLDKSEPDPANPAVLLAAGGSATGVHGTIYDQLVMEDFIPAIPGDWTTTNLYRNGYQVLWVPHWFAPGSCSDCVSGGTCPCKVRYPAATVTQALQTIGSFGKAGKDVFAECAGLGSFEGVQPTTAGFGGGVADTHFQTVLPSPLVGGFSFSTSGTASPAFRGSFASPLMQLGDYPFVPDTGAIGKYRPAGPSTAYLNVLGATDNTVQLVSESATAGSYDIFTHRPGLKDGHGAFVYLGGHSYSGTDSIGAFQVGGTRLVLNTLFNLGAACTESGVACDTGIPGACAKGTLKCRADGTTYCFQSVLPAPESCNGIDDDCNGLIDDGLIDPTTCSQTLCPASCLAGDDSKCGGPAYPSCRASCQTLDRGCYDGPTGTRDVGICHGGFRSCAARSDGSWGLTSCQGEVTPQPVELCNGLDDNCNGEVDEDLTRPCYDGDPSTLDPVTGNPRGACKRGIETCSAGSWGACQICTSAQSVMTPPPAECQVLPRADDCTCPECGGGGQDWSCDGVISQCGACTQGATRSCYTGPAGTAGVGICRAGAQTCGANLRWGDCLGEVLPQAEICDNDVDEDCNGVKESFALGSPQCGECLSGATRSCYDGLPASTQSSPPCHAGTQTCVSGAWTACAGQRKPGVELCNGVDDDCNGTIDDGSLCGPGLACINGVCAYDLCDNAERQCSEGYWCSAGHCLPTSCGTGAACPTGATCSNGACVDPNAGLHCAPPSIATGGICAGGGCYEAGCGGGQLCLDGNCVSDPCSGIICPGGTFCRGGDCVQACALVAACPAGQSCGRDGFCVADPCAGVTCAPNQVCATGACGADPCAGLACPRGQACQGGSCVDDPCAGVACPVGICQLGQCYATGSSAGTPAAPTVKTSGGCGCTTGGPATPLLLLALLAFAPLARGRRPRPRARSTRGGRGAALLGLLLLAAAAPACKKKTTTVVFDPASCTAPGVGLTACTGESRCVDLVVDPSHCGACERVCGAGQSCIDGGCFQIGAVAPFLDGASPATAPVGGLAPVRLDLTGQRFLAGASVRATHLAGTTAYAANVLDAGHLSVLIDLRDAPADTWHLRVVNPDRVISNEVTVTLAVPTPALTAISPASAAVGGVATVSLTGSGLMVDSLCMLGGPVGDQALPATLALPDRLDCQLDLGPLAPGTYQLWVANPTGAASPLVSNRLDFSATSNAAPHLDSLSPSTAAKGSVKPLTAFGTDFDSSSQVVLVITLPPAAAVEVPLSTQLRFPTELYVAQLDLSACPGGIAPCPATGEGTPPGASYAVKVRGGVGGAIQTGSLPFLVAANPPEISTVVPAFAYQGDTVPVTVHGANLPAGSVVQLAPAGGAFADAASPTSTTTQAQGTLDLVGTPPGAVPAGPYQVRLRLPGGDFTATLPFSVISNTAILQSVAPTSGVQGTNQLVTFNAAQLRPAFSDVKVAFSARPGQLLPTSGTNAPFTASLDLAGLDTGLYTLQVKNPSGAAPSNPASFTVRPGLPTLTAIAPASVAQQAARVAVALTGTSFARPDAGGFNGSTVHIFANCAPVVTAGQVTGCTCSGPLPCIPDQPLNLTYNQVTVTSSTRIDVLLDTASAIPATYSLWVWNPGGSPWQRSNQKLDAFTITP